LGTGTFSTAFSSTNRLLFSIIAIVGGVFGGVNSVLSLSTAVLFLAGLWKKWRRSQQEEASAAAASTPASNEDVERGIRGGGGGFLSSEVDMMTRYCMRFSFFPLTF
jgi:hypothetical protein